MDNNFSFSQFYDKLEEIIDSMFPERYQLSKDELDFYIGRIIRVCDGYYTEAAKQPVTTTDHSYYNDKNGKDLFYHFKNGLMGTEMYKGFLVGNIFKYITRHGKKDKDKTIEDLKKARDYLNELIEFEEEQINETTGD